MSDQNRSINISILAIIGLIFKVNNLSQIVYKQKRWKEEICYLTYQFP